VKSKPVHPTLADAAPIDNRVVDEVVKNYYAAAVNSADAARTRAQNGYAIASAIAAAIVAAGLLGGIDDARSSVKVLAVLAFVAWMTVAGLFMYAVAGNVSDLNTGEKPDAASFVRAVIANVREVRAAINARSGAAQVGVVIASILTVAAVVVALIFPPDSKSNGTILLTPVGAREVAGFCKISPPRRLSGSFEAGDLNHQFVAIELEDEACKGTSTLRVKRSSIVAISEPPH
jgi:MFS family permease